MKPLLLLVLAASALACATTEQARSVEPSGFLGDYSMLRDGGDGEPLLVYRDPDAGIGTYRKLLIDPVTIWRGPGSELAHVPIEEVQRLADYLHTALVEALRKDYELVADPGPGVARIRVAITEAEPSSVVMDVISTVIPHLRLLSGMKHLVTGTHAFVGAAAIEAEVTDVADGRRLAAMVDRRVGGKNLSWSGGSWNDVEEAYDFWVKWFQQRLAEERQRAAP